MATTLPQIERITARVIRILGCNPGAFTLQGTNSYLVGSGQRRILIDTSEPDHPQYLRDVGKVLSENNIQVQEIIITHWHHDHVGAVKELCRDVLKDRVKVSKIKLVGGKDVDLEPETDYTFISDDQTFRTEGATLKVIHTPGHSEDHLSLRLEEENAVFTGDCVLGEGTTVFEDLYDYMHSLERLLALNPGALYPGHGPVIQNGVDKLRQYIQHRNMRESQIVDTLRDKGVRLTAMELVHLIYSDISPSLCVAAMGNVLQHLSKLVKEKKVGIGKYFRVSVADAINEHLSELDHPEDEFLAALRRTSQERMKRDPKDVELLMSVKWHYKQNSGL